MSRPEVTVGVDIGTSSVKAIAADADGNVVASARVPHDVHVPSPGRFEHDAEVAWRRGPREALAAVATDVDVRGVSVAAMVPSLTAVDVDGVPLVSGMLYGDERGRESGGGERPGAGPGDSRELLGFLGWAARQAPDALGYWPAQAVANHALSGEGVLETFRELLARVYVKQDAALALAAEHGMTQQMFVDAVLASDVTA